MNQNNTKNDTEGDTPPENILNLFSKAAESTLTSEEKNKGLSDLKAFMKTAQIGLNATETPKTSKEASSPTKSALLSPYISAAYAKQLMDRAFIFAKNNKAAYASLMVCLVLGLTAGTAYAAQGSIPGDLLYPVKIRLEHIEDSLAIGPEAKAQVAMKHTIERLRETEKLATENQINETNESAVSSKINDSSEELEKHILKLNEEGHSSAAIHINADFEQSLQRHDDSIANIQKTASTSTQKELLKIRQRIRDRIDESQALFLNITGTSTERMSSSTSGFNPEGSYKIRHKRRGADSDTNANLLNVTSSAAIPSATSAGASMINTVNPLSTSTQKAAASATVNAATNVQPVQNQSGVSTNASATVITPAVSVPVPVAPSVVAPVVTVTETVAAPVINTTTNAVHGALGL